MKRARAGVCCVCWLLAVSAASTSATPLSVETSQIARHATAHTEAPLRALPALRALQIDTPTSEVPVAADASGGSGTGTSTSTSTVPGTTGSPTSGANSAGVGVGSTGAGSLRDGSEERAARSPVPSSQPSAADTTPAETPAPTTDGRISTDSSIDRDSSIGAETIIGIVAGAVAVVALAIAFVRLGASKRKLAQQQQLEPSPSATLDIAPETGILKDVKYVDSFESPSATPRASVASLRKPTVASLRSQRVSHVVRASDSRETHAGPAPSLEYSLSVTDPEPVLFTPSRVRSFSRSQRSASGVRSEPPKPTTELLSPESFRRLAQSSARQPFAQSRRSRQSSRAPSVESPVDRRSSLSSSSSPSAALSPPARRPSRLRFSRSSLPRVDSSNEIPMLGGGDMPSHDRASATAGAVTAECLAAQGDIPVLARGSEESVDSVEDEEVEISI